MASTDADDIAAKWSLEALTQKSVGSRSSEQHQFIDRSDVTTADHLIPAEDWGYFDLKTLKFTVSHPVITKKMLNDLLAIASQLKVDDVILQDWEPVWFKFNGEAIRVTDEVLSLDEVGKLVGIIHHESSFGKMTGGEELIFAYSVPVLANGEKNGPIEHVRFRVCGTATLGMHGASTGCQIVMRRLSSVPLTMEQLKVPQCIIDIAFPATGLVLVTGETGSGKTNLLGSFITHQATTGKGKNIICYGQPIEFDYRAIPNRNSCIAQTDINEALYSFAKAASNGFRRNPDIMELGEMRDKGSIDGGMLMAQSGHLVYSTIHTGSVEVTIPRMVEGYPAEEVKQKMSGLIEATQSIIHQRLVRTRDGGRIPIQSVLGLDGQIKEHLMAADRDKFVLVMGEMVQRYGLPLIQDLEAKKHLIEPSAYHAQMLSVAKDKSKVIS